MPGAPQAGEPMRSLLILPPRNWAATGLAGADIPIIDIVDENEAAVRLASELLASRHPAGTPVYVRIGPLADAAAEVALDVVVPRHPAGILLQASAGGTDAMRLAAMLAAREALCGLPDGAIGIVPVVATAAAVLTLATYAGATGRLCALAWDAEALAAKLGVANARDREGRLAEPLRVFRALCLAGAAATGVPAIDAAYADPPNAKALHDEAEAARRDGFAGKIAAGADQVEAINAAFGGGSIKPAAVSSR